MIVCTIYKCMIQNIEKENGVNLGGCFYAIKSTFYAHLKVLF